MGDLNCTGGRPTCYFRIRDMLLCEGRHVLSGEMVRTAQKECSRMRLIVTRPAVRDIRASASGSRSSDSVRQEAEIPNAKRGGGGKVILDPLSRSAGGQAKRKRPNGQGQVPWYAEKLCQTGGTILQDE
jgi:hypothetical protein